MIALRLFIAIELPADVLAGLNDRQHDLQRDPALARLRWVRPEGIHLTLKFLGETPEERRGEIEAAVGRSVRGVPPFELHLGKLGTVGNRKSPRVLWVDLGGDVEALAKLQSQVEAELGPLGFPGDGRPFSPHLTLARVPPELADEAARPLADAIAGRDPPGGSIHAEALSLMKSDLQRGGAVYTQLFSAKLG